MKPDFYIVGGQRCGTSAMRIYLNKHPEIFVADELHYYDGKKRSEEWRQSQYPKDKICGSQEPSYLHNPIVPEQIKRDIPNVKLIFIFRNPTERAHSLYWLNKLHYKEHMEFEEAVLKEETRKDNNNFEYAYKEIGCYSIHLRRYLKYFNKKQMLFLVSEDFRKNKKETIKKVLRFLGADENYMFTDLEDEYKSGVPRLSILSFSSRVLTYFGFRNLKYFINKMNTINGEKPEMKEETKKYLDEYFEKYNKELQDITGLDLEVWNER